MTRSQRARAKRAWAAVAAADEEIGELVDNIFCKPKTALSIPQLETAAAHLRAAKRLLVEVERREAPLFDERDCG